MPILYGVWDVVNRPISHILKVSSDIVSWAQKITIDYYTNNPIDGTKINAITSRIELYVLKLVNAKPELFSEHGDFVDKVTGFDNTLFGVVNFGDIPTLHPDVWNASAIGLLIIAFASGLFQLIMSIYSMVRSKRMNTSPAVNNSAMNSMNTMMLLMPVFSVWISLTQPAGLGFYWAISAIISLIQTVVLNKIYTPEYVAKLVEKDKAKNKKKNSKRQTMYQKYQEMIESQNTQISKNKKSIDEDFDDDSSIDNDNDNSEVKLSKSKQKEFERKIIAEARRRQAEKYGEEYIDED